MWMFPFWKHLIAFFRNKRWKVIGFTEGSMRRTRIPTVLLLCLSKEQRFFFSSKQVDYSAETEIFFFMEK